MDQDTKVHENRVRRWARRLNWRVEKSRARLLHVNNVGKYQLIDDYNGVRAGDRYDAELSDIEFALQKEEDRIRGFVKKD